MVCFEMNVHISHGSICFATDIINFKAHSNFRNIKYDKVAKRWNYVAFTSV